MLETNKEIANQRYQQFLTEIVNMVQRHRVLAVQSIQSISNTLYWNIGEQILQKQQEHKWGKSVIEQLSKDLDYHIGNGIS